MSASTGVETAGAGVEAVVVVESDGSAALTIGGQTTTLVGDSATTGRDRALRLLVVVARGRHTPVRFLAIDSSGQHVMLAHPDRSITRAGDTAGPAAGVLAGRGRITSLPAADALQVPDREDTGVARRGTPLGSPADAPATAAPVPSRPILVDDTESATGRDGAAVAARRRKARRAAGAVAVVAVLGTVSGSMWWRQVAAENARRAVIAEQAELQRSEVGWITGRQNAARVAAGEQHRAAVREQVSGARDEAVQLLGSSEGRVVDDAVRQRLQQQVDAVDLVLANGSAMDQATALGDLVGACDEVRGSQAQWERDEQARIAAEQAPAASSGDSGTASRKPATQSPAQQPAAQAPAQQPAAQAPAAQSGAARVTGIQPGYIEFSVSYVSISAVVTTNGETAVAVTATVDGQVVALSGPATVNGQATYSVTLPGVAAGSHTWSVAANGLSTSTKTKQVD